MIKIPERTYRLENNRCAEKYEGDMKIQFLNGGLANQAFQYIFARYYELSHPGEAMYLDDSYFALNTVHNGYELGKVFGLKPHMLSECFDEEVWNYILEERRGGKSVPQILCENGIPFTMMSEVGKSHQEFNPFTGPVRTCKANQYQPDILEIKDDIYYHGYWINKGWFARYENVFLGEFRFPAITDPTNMKYLEQIQSTHSLSLHVRRGDFVKINWAFGPEMYRKLLLYFLNSYGEKPWELFVFSDDIPWCKEHWKEMGLDTFRRVYYVEGNSQGRNYIDMQLMSQCEGMIISNSSFCYLAALLNTRKTAWVNSTMREI